MGNCGEFPQITILILQDLLNKVNCFLKILFGKMAPKKKFSVSHKKTFPGFCNLTKVVRGNPRILKKMTFYYRILYNGI